MDDFLIRALIVITALTIAFLLLRDVITWYWKQNEIVELLKEQNRLLRILVDNSETEDGNEMNNINEDANFETEIRKKTFFDKVKDAEVELKNKDKS